MTCPHLYHDNSHIVFNGIHTNNRVCKELQDGIGFTAKTRQLLLKFIYKKSYASFSIRSSLVSEQNVMGCGGLVLRSLTGRAFEIAADFAGFQPGT